MKQAIILHGTGGSSTDYFWFKDTKQYLESHGYQVWWPQLPNTERPQLQESLDYLGENLPFENMSEESIIIGHSSACPLLLTFLQYYQKQVKQVLLVAGFYQPIDDEGFSAMMLQGKEYDWNAIKAAAKEIVLINSDNDPWGCDDKQARPVAQKLEAIFVLAEGQGHMGSGSFGQPYRNFTLLKDLVKA